MVNNWLILAAPIHDGAGSSLATLPRSWPSARAAYLERRSPNANGLGGQNSV